MASKTDSFVMETNSQMYERANALADSYELEKKERRDFVEEKVKIWTAEQKEKQNEERERRAEERELRKLELEHELKLAEIRNQSQNQDQTNNETETKVHKAKFQFKVQSFNGKNEDIDKFLRVFERQCTLQNIAEKDWPGYLIQSLKEKAREAIAFMDIERMSYKDMKLQLLQYFVKTPDFYRLKFHNVQITDSDEPTAFVEDIKNYLLTWLEMSKVDITKPEQIINMLLLDKVLRMASDKLFSYIKERDIKTSQDIIKALQQFKDSHPNATLTKNDNIVNTMMRNNYSSNGNKRQNHTPNVKRRHSFSPNMNRKEYTERNDRTNRDVKKKEKSDAINVAAEIILRETA